MMKKMRNPFPSADDASAAVFLGLRHIGQPYEAG